MREVVRASFVPFSKPLEGFVLFPYLDCLGLVTTGMGCLIDPLSPDVLALPWLYMGTLATRDEITQCWDLTKSRKDLAAYGGGTFENLTPLRLSEASVNQLVLERLAFMDAVLARRFSNWETLPADAQLACLSMSWAMGAYFYDDFPTFSAALDRSDFSTCSVQCHMEDSTNPGLVKRNALNAGLFISAGAGGDPDTIWSGALPG